jgi:hypothetical protein
MRDTLSIGPLARRHVCATLLYVGLAVATTGCPNNGDEGAGEGESCAVSADCRSDLVCRELVCTAPAGQPDMGMMDGSMPDGGGETNNGMPEPEDYFISYVFIEDDNYSLRLLRTGNGEDRRIDPDTGDVPCTFLCGLSRDLSIFFYARPTMMGAAGNYDIYTIETGADYTASGTGEVLVRDVRGMRVVGDTLTYIRDVDDGNGNTAPYAYHVPLDGAEADEVQLGFLATDPRSEDAWAVAPEHDLGLLYRRTLNTLEILVGGLEGTVSDAIFTLDGRNFQMVGGSFYSGELPTAVSPDGRLVAFLARGPNNYQACQMDADCTGGPARKCGNEGFCTALEVSAYVIDRDNTNLLGQPCAGDNECGGIHECYVPSPVQADKARCIPRRVTLGLPDTPPQGPDGNTKTGCEWTRGDTSDQYHYTDFASSISFDENNNLYLVGKRNCSGGPELNLPDADILKITPGSGDYEVVYGNPGSNYRDINCYDTTNQEIDVTKDECFAYIDSALLSPGGNEFAFLGNNPQVSTPELTVDRLDVWSVLRDGTEQEWLGGHSAAGISAQNMRVHPIP